MDAGCESGSLRAAKNVGSARTFSFLKRKRVTSEKGVEPRRRCRTVTVFNGPSKCHSPRWAFCNRGGESDWQHFVYLNFEMRGTEVSESSTSFYFIYWLTVSFYSPLDYSFIPLWTKTHIFRWTKVQCALTLAKSTKNKTSKQTNKTKNH